METRLGQAAPLVVAMEAILAPLSWKWKRLLRDPVRASDSSSCPEEASVSKPAQEGFWFLWDVLSCLSGPGVLSCHVLFCVSSPGGLLIPPDFPREILGGVEGVPAVGAGPRGPRPRPPKTICHGLQSSQLRHGLLSSQLHHGLLSSMHRHGFQSSQLRYGHCLSVPLWRSPSCVLVRICPEGPPERPPPLPDGTVKARDEPFGRGELCQGSVLCVMCSRLLCPYMVCFLSLFHVIMS